MEEKDARVPRSGHGNTHHFTIWSKSYVRLSFCFSPLSTPGVSMSVSFSSTGAFTMDPSKRVRKLFP